MEYFVYFASVKNGISGDGNCEVKVDGIIDAIEDIRGIEIRLKKENGFDSVAVANFIRLK